MAETRETHCRAAAATLRCPRGQWQKCVWFSYTSITCEAFLRCAATTRS